MSVAVRRKRLGVWRETTLDDLRTQVGATRDALAALGLGAGSTVVVLSDNRPEWLVVDLAAGELGADVVGLDPAAPVASVPVGAVVVAEDEEQLDKLAGVAVPVVVVDPPAVMPPGLATYAELSDRAAEAATLDAPADGPGAGDQLLSHVPMSDPGERAMLSAAVRRGATVNFGDGASPLLAELREVQPTVFRAPASTWQAFLDGVERRAADATPLKRAAYHRRFLVRRKVRQALGLGRVRQAVSTGPLPQVTLDWFRGFGIDVQTPT